MLIGRYMELAYPISGLPVGSIWRASGFSGTDMVLVREDEPDLPFLINTGVLSKVVKDGFFCLLPKIPGKHKYDLWLIDKV